MSKVKIEVDFEDLKKVDGLLEDPHRYPLLSGSLSFLRSIRIYLYYSVVLSISLSYPFLYGFNFLCNLLRLN